MKSEKHNSKQAFETTHVLMYNGWWGKLEQTEVGNRLTVMACFQYTSRASLCTWRSFHKATSNKLSTLLLQAALCRGEIYATVSIRIHHIRDVCGIAVKMDIVTPSGLNQACCCPHADTPAIPIVRTDLVIPLKSCLPCDLPEVSTSPIHWRPR